MKTIKERIAEKNWSSINTQLHDKGFVIVKNMLTPAGVHFKLSHLCGDFNFCFC
jgi:hypothetical protein